MFLSSAAVLKAQKGPAPQLSAAPSTIAFTNVSKRFGQLEVLGNINLRIEAGQKVVIVGPSGSGKSTLLRCINGLERVSSGHVHVGPFDLADPKVSLREVRKGIGMVFQNFNLYPHRTALDNITLALRVVQKKKESESREIAMQYLGRVGLADKAGSYPAQLSGGQQQRVAIARALAMHPSIMLFDEPTSALDPEMIQEVLEVMADVAHDGLTMVVVTHEMGFARRFAERVVFVDGGQIVEDTTSESFFQRPQHERAKQFLDRILKH